VQGGGSKAIEKKRDGDNIKGGEGEERQNSNSLALRWPNIIQKMTKKDGWGTVMGGKERSEGADGGKDLSHEHPSLAKTIRSNKLILGRNWQDN